MSTSDRVWCNAGGSNYGDSVVKLGTTNGLAVIDYFTPSTEASLDANDNDFGSGGTAVLVDQPTGPVAHLMIGGGKDGNLFLLNRDAMGRFNTSANAVIQTITESYSIFATPAFWQNSLYIAGSKGALTQFVFNPVTGKFGSTLSTQSSTMYPFPGATPSLSSNGTTNGIVWTLDNSQYCTPQAPGCGPAVLHAHDATNVAVELWNSSQAPGQRDQAGRAVKFVVPTVATARCTSELEGTTRRCWANSTCTRYGPNDSSSRGTPSRRLSHPVRCRNTGQRPKSSRARVAVLSASAAERGA